MPIIQSMLCRVYRILEKLVFKRKSLMFDEDEDGNTPLHLAASQGWKHAVKFLIDRKVNIDARWDL